LLEVLTLVGSFESQKFVRTSRKPKNPAWVSEVIPTLGVLAKVGSLPKVPVEARTSGRPNLKPCSNLAFWILIRTILNSWETWKISLGEVSY
jgi:hypothetical protein